MQCSFCATTVTKGSYGFIDGKGYCFPCCGRIDRFKMIVDGRAFLYRFKEHGRLEYLFNLAKNLRFPVELTKIKDQRRLILFQGPDNHIWEGYYVGRRDICLKTYRTPGGNSDFQLENYLSQHRELADHIRGVQC